MYKAYKFRSYPIADRKFLLNHCNACNSTIAMSIKRPALITSPSVRPWTEAPLPREIIVVGAPVEAEIFEA